MADARQDHNAELHVDAVVIGGGLAGQAAAIHLARGGLQVLCLEARESFPKIVGESLDWSAPQLFSDLGLTMDDLVATGAATFKRHITVIAPDGSREEFLPGAWLSQHPWNVEVRTLHLDRHEVHERLKQFWQIAMRRAISGEANRSLRRAFYKPFSGRAGAWQFMRLVRWGRPEDMLTGIPAILAQLSMPALVFRGSHDVLPAAFSERAASLIPRSDIVTVDAGHFIPLERPSEVATSLVNFFRENGAEVIVPRQDSNIRVSKVHAPRTERARLQSADGRLPVGATT